MSTSLEPIVPRVPPGADDLPCGECLPMETARHRNQMNLLIESLKLAWTDRADFYVGGNMFMYFSVDQARYNDFVGPDVFVVLDTVRRERKSWVVWEEGGQAPNVVIELLSESTEKSDRGKKMRIYATQLRVPEYFLFDPFTGLFEGYELEARGRYRPMKPDARGNLSSHEVGLRLGVREGVYEKVETRWLRWLDAEGAVLPSKEDLLAIKYSDLAAKDAEIAALRARLEAHERKG